MLHKLRHTVAAMLLIAGSMLFAIILVEGVLRLFPELMPAGAQLMIKWHGETKPWNVPHPYIGYLLLPNQTLSGDEEGNYHTDNFGFRNSWPWPEKAEMVAVGDSMTASQMVKDDQAWTAILENKLRDTHIVNLGLPGASPQQYLRIYETFGIPLHPKLLLVGLFLANDLEDAGKFDNWLRSGAKGKFKGYKATQGIRSWIWRVRDKIYLYALLREFWHAFWEGRLFCDKIITFSDGSQIKIVPRFLTRPAALAQPHRHEFKLIFKTLKRIQKIANQNHTQCLVLFFPSKEEVYLPTIGEEAPDLAKPFLKELDRVGIAHINFGPIFRQKASAGEKLFFETDGHPNARGYALIAQSILLYIKNEAKIHDWEFENEIRSKGDLNRSISDDYFLTMCEEYQKSN